MKRAYLVHMVTLENQVQKVLLDYLEPRVLESPERMAYQGYQDLLDPMVSLVLEGCQVSLDFLVLGEQAHQVLKGIRVHQAHPDTQETKVNQVFQAIQVPLDF